MGDRLFRWGRNQTDKIIGTKTKNNSTHGAYFLSVLYALSSLSCSRLSQLSGISPFLASSVLLSASRSVLILSASSAVGWDASSQRKEPSDRNQVNWRLAYFLSKEEKRRPN